MPDPTATPDYMQPATKQDLTNAVTILLARVEEMEIRIEDLLPTSLELLRRRTVVMLTQIAELQRSVFAPPDPDAPPAGSEVVGQ
jgi:hypothetical protein